MIEEEVPRGSRIVASSGAALKKAIRSVEALIDPAAVSDRELLRRFAEENDQAAFAALVRRYTGMVLGVCRRALPNVHDAEDACQATFLVLARKAPGKWRQSVANWLYTTARRVASNARLAAERRARREGRAAVPAVASPVDQVTGRELLAALDEELDKLAARYREPLVLCYLEGLTREETATRLGVPAGTVKTRLERGRERLAAALTRRGCGLGAGLLALAVTSPAGASPPRLVQAVLAAVSGSPPEAVAALAKGVLVNGLVNKSLPAALLLVVALLGAAAGFRQTAAGYPPPAAGRTPREAKRGSAAPAPPEGRAARSVTGRILGPGGEAVKGSRVFLCPRHRDEVLAEAAVAADGTFRLTFDPGRLASDEDGQGWQDGRLLAAAPGHGPVWARLGDVAHAGWEARLARGGVAVEGTLTTLEGTPVAGAEISLSSLRTWPSPKALDGYLAGVSGGTGQLAVASSWWWGPVPGLPRVWRTDARGRYRISGLGSDRVAVLRVGGPRVAWTALTVVTRDGKVLGGRARRADESPEVVLPAKHTFSLAPGRTITGVVKEEGSARPVVGMRVSADGGGPAVVTGADGRFELLGNPKKERYTVYAFPTEKAPAFVNAQATVAGDAPGLADQRVEITVRRGIPLRVKVIDKATGKRVPADVSSMPVFPSRDVPANLSSPFLRLFRQPDGSYLGAAQPGPGAVAVRRSDGRYVPVTRVSQKEFFKLDGMPNRDYGASEDYLWVAARPGVAVPTPLPPAQFQAVKLINPSKGTKEISLTLEVDQGRTKLLRLTDATGAAVAGARWIEQIGGNWSEPLPGAELQVPGVGEGWPRPRMIRHEEKRLAAALTVKADTPNPLTVTLRPWATLSGRLVGKGGAPLAYHRLLGLPGVVLTDSDGRFRADGLAAEADYTVRVEGPERLVGRLPGPIRLKPGEEKDLGDVRMKQPEE
jgi:RNA polymerase sigma factor (sigma-70 family)